MSGGFPSRAPFATSGHARPPLGSGFERPRSQSLIGPLGEAHRGLDPLEGLDLVQGPGQLGRVEGLNDPLGIGRLGRSDLDPLAPVGPGTGMLADPRGLRSPRGPAQGLPPGHPPGARFDPFGPAPPGPPSFGGGAPDSPRQGHFPGQLPQPPFGGPSPDHLPMPPFSGEELPQPGQPRRDPPTPFGGPAPDHDPPPPGFGDMFM